MDKSDNKWIKRLDIGRLIVALGGIVILGAYMLNPDSLPLNHMMSNIVAMYVLLMGMKTHILGVNRTLAWFYMFFSSMMLVVVNMIWYRFG